MTATPTASSPVAPPTRPVPRRFWWLKRLGAAWLAWLLFLVAVRIWWGHVADARWNAMLAQLRAGGHAARLADYATDPIPDADNAAVSLQQAGAQITAPPSLPGSVSADSLVGRLRDWTATEQTQASQLIAANSAALALAHTARGQSGVDWNLPLSFQALWSGLGMNFASQRSPRTPAPGRRLAAAPRR